MSSSNLVRESQKSQFNYTVDISFLMSFLMIQFQGFAYKPVSSQSSYAVLKDLKDLVELRSYPY